VKTLIYVLIIIAGLVKLNYLDLPPFAIEIANHKLIEMNLSVFISICLMVAVKKYWPAAKKSTVTE
jgi:hypothetical protein